MHKANLSGLINQHLSGKPAQLEQFDLLTVQFQDPMFGIG